MEQETADHYINRATVIHIDGRLYSNDDDCKLIE